jgi:hypothetical protein
VTADPRFEQRLRVEFQALSTGAAFGPDCPAPDRLWAGARGEASPSDVAAMALHMEGCGACAGAWRLARELDAPPTYAAPAANIRWWLPLAAALELATGASLLYVLRQAPSPASPPSPTPVTTTFVIALERAPVRVSSRYALTWRGAGDGRVFLEALKAALEPYERGDYAAAIAALGPLHEQYRDTSEPAFYLGVATLLTGEAAAAIPLIERARDLAEPEQLEDVTWWLASAYERAGRRDEARRTAQTVCKQQGSRSVAACAAAAALGGR